MHLMPYVEFSQQVTEEFVAEMNSSVGSNCTGYTVLANELRKTINCVYCTVLECRDAVQEATEIAHNRHNVLLARATGLHMDEVDSYTVKRAITVVDVSSGELAALHVVALLAHAVGA